MLKNKTLNHILKSINLFILNATFVTLVAFLVYVIYAFSDDFQSFGILEVNKQYYISIDETLQLESQTFYIHHSAEANETL